MGLNVSQYYDISCGAKVDNLRAPECLAISAGGFEPSEVEAAALATGWTKGTGKNNWGCPGHPLTATPAAAKRTPKSRDQILDPAVSDVPAQ